MQLSLHYYSDIFDKYKYTLVSVAMLAKWILVHTAETVLMANALCTWYEEQQTYIQIGKVSDTTC